MPGAGVLRRSRTAAIAAANAQPIAPTLMNRGDEDARTAPVSDEWPAPFFDRDRRVATIAQQKCLVQDGSFFSDADAALPAASYRSKETQSSDRCELRTVW